MTLHFLGVSLYEVDVAVTDFILCIACIFFAYSILQMKVRDVQLQKLSACFFGAVSSSSLLGGFFHLLFPQKATTPPGFILWVLVAGSIGVTAIILWRLVSHFIVPKYEKHVTSLAVASFIYFLYYIIYVDYTFKVITFFYLPSIVALLLVALYKKNSTQERGWNYCVLGVLLSFVASGVQLAHISVHPVYFNFNALYHVIQLVALYVLYRGFAAINE